MDAQLRIFYLKMKIKQVQMEAVNVIQHIRIYGEGERLCYLCDTTYLLCTTHLLESFFFYQWFVNVGAFYLFKLIVVNDNEKYYFIKVISSLQYARKPTTFLLMGGRKVGR